MVKFNICGTGFKGFAVTGQPAGLVGYYVAGEPYRPNEDQVRAALPFRLRKAFDRAAFNWWFDRDNDRACYRQLRRRNGTFITTVYANVP